jgi:hypothetical protein
MDIYIEQTGKDCIITHSPLRRIKDCNALKLANTLWDKEGDKYTVEQMEKWGFVLKEK